MTAVVVVVVVVAVAVVAIAWKQASQRALLWLCVYHDTVESICGAKLGSSLHGDDVHLVVLCSIASSSSQTAMMVIQKMEMEAPPAANV